MEQHIEAIRQIVIEALTNAVNYVADRITDQFRMPAQEDGEQEAEQAGDINADNELYEEEDHGQQDPEQIEQVEEGDHVQPDPEQMEEIDIEGPEQFQEREQEEEGPGDSQWHFRIRQNGREECCRLHHVINQV